MKKLGLRAVAGSLAVLMVASVFAPATTANAADVLVTAKAPKTLVITADMVDDDGEIVISNENWDRIIVENDVVAKDIYFDGVEVGELVVESGSKSKVQLWEVEAEQVTVQEPEFNEISLKDILPLLADKETQQAALNMYLENKAANEAAAKLVPTVVTQEGAKVEAVVARANAKLDLAGGDVAVVALEASDKLDRATVTLKNYDGDVTYKGNDQFSSMTLKNVNSTISLTVDESTDKNFFTVTGKNSLVEKAEVAGNAQVALDAPMGVVEISEKATAAQVLILNTADEMNVASKGAKVELTMNANVAVANVTADNVKVEGQGTLKEANLEGKGAYVSTNGTKVEGENTYVKPVYVEKPEDIEHTFATLGAGGWGFNRLGNTDGGEVYKLNGGWSGEVFYVLPKSVDTCLYSEAVIKVKTEPGQKVTVKLTHEGADKDSWGNPVAFYSKEVTGEVELVVPLTLQAGKMIDQVRFQSSQDEVTATLYSVEFKLNPNGPVEPIVPPADGTLCTPNTWEVVKLSSVDFRQFAGKTVKITLEAIRLGGEDHLANGQFCNPYTVIHWQKAIGSEWTDFGSEAWEVPADWATAASPVNYGIRTVDGEDYSTSLIYYRNFSVEVVETEGGETEEPTPEEPTTTPEPEDPTPAAPSTLAGDWEVYTAADFTKDGYGYEATDAEYYNGEDVAISGQYQEIRYMFAEDVNLALYDKMIVTFSTKSADAADYLVIKLVDKEAELDEYNNSIPMLTKWDCAAVDTTDVVIDLADYADEKLSWVAFMAKNGATEMTFYRIALLPKAGTTTPEVTPDPTPEVTVTITEPAKATLTLDDTLTLSAVASVSGSAVVWTSSNTAVATVDENGVVTPVAAGTVTITATCGEATDTVDLTVEKAFYLKGWDGTANKWVINSKDVAFDVTTASMWGNILAPLNGHYGLNEYLGAMLPTSLAGTDLSTVDAIKANVDKFVFTTVVTKCTSETATMQGVVQAGQTYNYAGAYSEHVKVGEASQAAPAVVIAEVPMTATADLQEIAQTSVQFVDTVEGTQITGTYTIKVVLK